LATRDKWTRIRKLSKFVSNFKGSNPGLVEEALEGEEEGHTISDFDYCYDEDDENEECQA